MFGAGNILFGDYSMISGGGANVVSGTGGWAAGVQANISDDHCFVWSTSITTIGAQTSTNDVRQAIFNLRDAAYTPAPSDPNTFFINGNLLVTGNSTTIGAKAFSIPHPILQGKTLKHFCIEGPNADLIYRGLVTLTNGQAEVNIDESSKMSQGTFSALVENPQIYLSNTTNWDLVKVLDKSTLITGKFIIVSNNNQSTAEIDWFVIAKRKDITQPIEI